MNLKVKLFISDVDGVMTDGGIYYSEQGERIKKLNVYDAMGFSILKDRGLQAAIFYAAESPIVDHFADDMGIELRYQNVPDKHQLAQEICVKDGLSMNEVAFIGDDTNDRELMANAGIAACPANAPKSIRSIPDILILKKEGGEGVVREFIDYIVENGFC